MVGVETLVKIATDALSNLIITIVAEKGGSLVKKIDFDLLKGLTVQKCMRTYAERYIDNYGKLKVSCAKMDSPVDLDHIYTPVKLLKLKDFTSQYFDSLESLDNLLRKSRQRRLEFHTKKACPGMDFANEHKYLMILGGPGVGKSTFLRKVGLEALKNQSGDYEHTCIPVMIEMRLFDPDKQSMVGRVAQEFDHCGLPEPYEFAQLFLESGRLLLLLDGIDEIPHDREAKVLSAMDTFVKSYPDNRFIASCRLAAYIFGFERFEDVAITSFEDNQIKQYIDCWFRSEEDKRKEIPEKCWRLLNNREYESAKELAQTPLLLTLLCVVFGYNYSFPNSRTSLYAEALDIFLKNWSSEKQLDRNSIYKNFSPELERLLLSEVAHETFQLNQLLFTKNYVKNRIKNFLRKNLNAPKSLDGDSVIKAIEIQQGIFVRRAWETYSFSHITLQEYLTAQFIVDNHQTNHLIGRHIFEDRWREVFLLSISMLRGREDADKFLKAMHAKIMASCNSPKVRQIIDFAQRIVDYQGISPESVSERAAIRAASLYFFRIIQSCYTRDFEFKSSQDPVCIRALHLSAALGLPPDANEFRTFGYILDFPIDYIRAKARIPVRNRRSDGRVTRIRDNGSMDSGENAINRLRTLKVHYKIFKNSYLSRLEQEMLYLKNTKLNHTSKSHIENWKKKTVDAYLDCLKIDPSLLTISQNEVAELANICYASELLVKCRNSAVYVNESVWKGIASRILRVAPPAKRQVPSLEYVRR